MAAVCADDTLIAREMAKTDDLPDFAARLSRIMGQLNFSRAALARELALDKTVVGRWLTGVNVPTEHNLTRLTEIVRRHRVDFTLAHWRGDAGEVTDVAEGRPPPASARSAAAEPPPTSRMKLSGLRRPARPEDGAPYLGLWGGFYLSTANRGLVPLCVMRFAIEGEHLYTEFSEGSLSGDGPVIILGGRLHVVVELRPALDRLAFLVFNAFHAPRAMIIDGIVTVAAADQMGTPIASPLLLFRLDDALDGHAVPSVADLHPRLSDINQRIATAASETGDLWAFWRGLMPDKVRDALRVQVGVPRGDGELDHLLRMPASRSLAMMDMGFAALPVDAPERVTTAMLRRLLGIG